jgi:hypothetical protein
VSVDKRLEMYVGHVSKRRSRTALCLCATRTVPVNDRIEAILLHDPGGWTRRMVVDEFNKNYLGEIQLHIAN